MKLGQRIKKIRELKSIKQEDIAYKLGITQSFYSKMEIGKIDIPFSRLEEIASAIGVAVEDIICFNDESIVFNLKNNKRANGLVINQISNEQKKLYDEYVKTLQAEISHLKEMVNKLLNKK